MLNVASVPRGGRKSSVRPLTRLMTVIGASAGAMLPDVWDWKWFRDAPPAARRVAKQQIRRRAAELPEAEALELFGLSPAASADELKTAWRQIAKRYHP